MTSPTPAAARREFLGQLATATVALAGTACMGPRAMTAASAAPAPAPKPTDDWTARLTGKHKAVFDSPEIDDGTGIANAYVFMMGYKDMYGLTDADLSTVLVIRHGAIPMALDDTFWEKYDLGREARIKDPATKKWARRNPFYKAAPGDTENAAFTLDALHARGTILLGCGLAAGFMAGRIARKTGQTQAAVMGELRQHLVPGLELQPSGIFAVTRAQEAGCSYVRST
jgi:hypothetical protein